MEFMEHKMFFFALQISLETFLIPRNNVLDMIIDVHKHSLEVRDIRLMLKLNLIFSRDIKKSRI